MISAMEVKIQNCILHRIGNKVKEEGVKLSKSDLDISGAIEELLINYFFTPFKTEEFYNFYHDADINLNEVYSFASKIFDNPECVHEQSVNIATHLYEQSNHPKIKTGELYVVYFKDCLLGSERVDAVGVFKSENKDTFLKVFPSGDGFEIESELGVNINKLDKGVLIFNTDQENGYVVAVVDNINKGTEAHYWIDDFLHIRQRQDEYYNTHNVLSMCKTFITKELPQQFDVSKADQADLMNKSVQFFKDKDSFDIDQFTNEVIEQQEVIDSFHQFRDDYQRNMDIEIVDQFDISDTAVKKQARAFKSVIKLDKNFHIYVHGDKNLIEQGEDVKGKFYKVYYTEEQ